MRTRASAPEAIKAYGPQCASDWSTPASSRCPVRSVTAAVTECGSRSDREQDSSAAWRSRSGAHEEHGGTERCDQDGHDNPALSRRAGVTDPRARRSEKECNSECDRDGGHQLRTSAPSVFKSGSEHQADHKTEDEEGFNEQQGASSQSLKLKEVPQYVHCIAEEPGGSMCQAHNETHSDDLVWSFLRRSLVLQNCRNSVCCRARQRKHDSGGQSAKLVVVGIAQNAHGVAPPPAEERFDPHH